MKQFDQAWYANWLARRFCEGFREGRLAARSGEAREACLHQAILDECRRRGWIALHGSMAHQTKRTIGEPDFVILADGGRVLLVECKSKEGKLRPEQAALHAWAAKLGHTVRVVRSLNEFLQIIHPKT
jgi:hypothetical protein